MSLWGTFVGSVTLHMHILWSKRLKSKGGSPSRAPRARPEHQQEAATSPENQKKITLIPKYRLTSLSLNTLESSTTTAGLGHGIFHLSVQNSSLFCISLSALTLSKTKCHSVKTNCAALWRPNSCRSTTEIFYCVTISGSYYPSWISMVSIVLFPCI